MILSRRKGEQIRVGDDVVLTVLDIKGNRVRLGFDAPEDRSIIRGELTEVVESHTAPTGG